MSQENVEIVRACYECFARHEFPEQYLAPDFEWTSGGRLPDPGTRRGIEAVRQFFREWVSGWAEVHNRPVEMTPVDDAVVVFVHGRFRLTPDSIPFEADYAHLWRLRDGLAVSVHALDRADALEAVGLSE
jgi:ketosteroid isomerase-like protein